jgi:signal transduction histidine kinase
VQAVVADDYLVLQHIVDGLSSQKKVLNAMVIKEDGTVLVHSRPNERGKRYQDASSLLAAGAQGPLLQRYETADGIPVYDFAVPVYVLDQKQAAARVGISIEGEVQAIRRTRNSIILVGLVVLAVGLAWATYQARRVTRPIQELVRGTHEIAKGRLDHRISVPSGDELGELAEAFNKMTEAVQAMVETSRTLSSTLDADVVLRSIASHALTLVKADVAFIAPLDRTAQQATVKVALGARTDGLLNASVTPGRGMGGLVLTNGEPFATLDYLTDPRFAHDPAYDELARQEGILSQLAVPISLKGEIVGLLWVANRTAKTFAQEDVDSLQRMAQQAAIAMENARLYQDLQRSHRELLAAETELVRTTRMATMGEIAAMVAHETRNPLGALSNCVQLLWANPHIIGEDAELLDIIQKETQRLNQIVSDFLAFGRPRAPQFQDVDLHELINEAFAFLQRDDRCSSSIVFLRQFDDSLGKVWADRDQLRQVFWNLFLNAVQAMKDSGMLQVETRKTASGVEILVRDTGPGIPKTVLPNIFEPFYGTRPGGTGLGLAIVRRIVEEHGGQITVESQAGAGTCFLIALKHH